MKMNKGRYVLLCKISHALDTMRMIITVDSSNKITLSKCMLSSEYFNNHSQQDVTPY